MAGERREREHVPATAKQLECLRAETREALAPPQVARRLSRRSRHTRFTSRAASSPIRTARCLLERASAKPTMTTMSTATPIRAVVRSRA